MNEESVEKRSLDIAEGDVININQSTVRSVDGDHINLQQVGALSVDGDRVNMEQTAACLIRGGHVNLNQSISCLSASEQMNISSSLSPLVVGRDKIEVRDSASGILAARDVKAENVKTLLLAASKVEGNVTTLFDWRSALSFGAILGGIIGFVSLLKRK
ncbi:MAG: hypothetical protein D6710_09930 [Nitrospirae bacterium]|nr:MAG: hypothetical protein D6710_09930 [Nitrospirota bacterium]